MLKKLFASRKYTTCIATILLVVLNEVLHMDISEEAINNVVITASVWIGSQAALDGVAVIKGKKDKV